MKKREMEFEPNTNESERMVPTYIDKITTKQKKGRKSKRSASEVGNYPAAQIMNDIFKRTNDFKQQQPKFPASNRYSLGNIFWPGANIEPHSTRSKTGKSSSLGRKKKSKERTVDYSYGRKKVKVKSKGASNPFTLLR